MKIPNLYFHVYLAALLMFTAVPAEAADVKELFAIDLADYPGKEGRMIEVTYPPGAEMRDELGISQSRQYDHYGERSHRAVGLY
jgi:hypothetical protein